jgi:hypothetical protein
MVLIIGFIIKHKKSKNKQDINNNEPTLGYSEGK